MGKKTLLYSYSYDLILQWVLDAVCQVQHALYWAVVLPILAGGRRYEGSVKVWRHILLRSIIHCWSQTHTGNDVASGLKWMLASNSVVFMPLPRVETWAMESLLQVLLCHMVSCTALLTHSIVFFNSLGSTLFPSARIFWTCSTKWNGVSVIWIFVMPCRKGRRSTLGKEIGELVSLPPSTNAF